MKASIALRMGPSTATMIATGRAKRSAVRSGFATAMVLGRTSAKTTTSTDIVAVA